MTPKRQPMSYKFPQSLLVQFAKAPELGKVKTRMQPQLSVQQSLLLHCQLVKHTYSVLARSGLAPIELWYSGRDQSKFFETLIPPPFMREQQGADLGMRMYHALGDGLERYETVVLVGSDCPFLTQKILREAFELLSKGSDCVLGPATDGGYVLIGLTRNNLKLFTDVKWGSDGVAEQTRCRLRELAWQWRELAPLADIDTADDIKLLRPLK